MFKSKEVFKSMMSGLVRKHAQKTKNLEKES